MNYQPLIIIGAGRSGTNILRDTLTAISGWSTWDCDEINLIWRHRNLDMPHDIFGAEQARPEVARYIRDAFDRFQRKSAASVVVEKTCANSLRVPFIDAILPQARYIYIVRDGRDVALSAAQRWTSSIEPQYLIKKLRYAPVSDIPHYGGRFIANRLHQWRSREKRQASWGPIFPGMSVWVRDYPLIDVCAQQWACCVQESDRSFSSMAQDKWIKVHYEDLVRDPGAVIANISDWYGTDDLVGQIPGEVIGRIHAGSLNGWQRKSDRFTEQAMQIMDPLLARHGYGSSA